MKYIIELSEEDYMMYSNDEWNVPLGLVDALKKATPLPKGHGDLIDSSYEVSTDGRTVYDVCGYLAPTIIEADGSE